MNYNAGNDYSDAQEEDQEELSLFINEPDNDEEVMNDEEIMNDEDVMDDGEGINDGEGMEE